MRLRHWAGTLLAAWRGDLEGAARALQAMCTEQDRVLQSWVGAALAWAEAEQALATGDLAAARQAAAVMLQRADRHGHDALCVLAHRLAIGLHSRSDGAAQVLDELRQMERRQQIAHTESLHSRARLITWQLELRANRQSVQRLERATVEYQRLALQDPLTQLANRRQFEDRLCTMIAANGAGTLYLAMVDVDRFKQINDSFSHAVGDAVLAGIAGILQSQLRSTDLPARLGGDEFALAFHAGSPLQAEQLCERISVVVRNHDWASVVPGMAVSISIGLSQLAAGDTLATALDRSDAAMYACKRRARSAG